MRPDNLPRRPRDPLHARTGTTLQAQRYRNSVDEETTPGAGQTSSASRRPWTGRQMGDLPEDKDEQTGTAAVEDTQTQKRRQLCHLHRQAAQNAGRDQPTRGTMHQEGTSFGFFVFELLYIMRYPTERHERRG